MSPLHICMAIDYFYPVVGGSEIQAYRLSQRLSKMGLKVSIITRKLRGLSEPKNDEKLKIYRLPIFGNHKTASCVFLFQICLFFLRHRTEFDIIHCHLATSTALGCMMTGMLTKTPVLIKLGGGGKIGDIQKSLSTRPGRLKLSLLKRGPCHLTAPNQEIVKEVIETGFSPERIRIIPNGVDTDYFFPFNPIQKKSKKMEMGTEDKYLALYVGRFDPNKNILLLIDGWARLHQKHEKWDLWIIGSGILKETIHNRIREKGMTDRIMLISEVSPDKIKDYFQIGDLFIQPSSFEGLSNAILEAMSCGLPIIASKIWANQDLIKDGFNGLLFNPGDIEDLVRCLEIALKDEKKRENWGLNARKRVVEGLDLSHIASTYIEYYHRILSG